MKDWVNDLCERNYLDLDSIKLGVAALQGVKSPSRTLSSRTVHNTPLTPISSKKDYEDFGNDSRFALPGSRRLNFDRRSEQRDPSPGRVHSLKRSRSPVKPRSPGRTRSPKGRSRSPLKSSPKKSLDRNEVFCYRLVT